MKGCSFAVLYPLAGTHKERGRGNPVVRGYRLNPYFIRFGGIEYTPLRKLDGIDWGQRLLDEKAPAMDRVLYSYWGGKTSVRISYYLLDAEGHLYKTDIDREQRKDVSDKEPEI